MPTTERIPRWVIAVGVWITLALVSVVGWGFRDYKRHMEEMIESLQARVLILEKQEISQTAALENIRARLIEIQKRQQRLPTP